MKNKRLKFILITGLLTLGLWFFAFADNTWDNNTWSTVENQLPQILIDTSTNTIYISGYVQSWATDTWSNIDTNTGNVELEDTAEIETNTTPVDLETEFANALAWMYSNWLTMYDNKEEYRMYDLVTREEASKIIWKAYSVLWYSDIVKNASCSFSDSDTFDPTLSSHISNVCKRWLFKGSNGKYMPQDNLTKAQWMAVLLRMFEWKMSYELQIPWREQYYTKWKLIWLTNVENINEFDTKLTRYEIALMIYRLKNIATNAQLKATALNKLWKITVQTNTWIMDSNTVIDNLGTLIWWIDPHKDPELLEAIYWMFDNWLTIYNNPNDYKPFETLSRAWAAKIFDKFSDMLGLSVNQSLSVEECTFTDVWSLDLATQQHIVNICRKWILKWNNSLFSPDTNVNKSHFVVSLIRMFQWKYLDETTNPRRENYFNEAKELWIVSPSDAITFDTPISRYEVALFLYKFNIKYKMLSSLNNTRIENEVLSTVQWSISTWTNGKLMANVYVDSNLLKQWSFDIWYIEIFGTRYKIVKSSESIYFTENFVRYGDTFDLATDEKLWTINFVVSNGYIVESMIRFSSGENYKIAPVSWTSTYYSIKGL
jgi:hypothetical protein